VRPRFRSMKCMAMRKSSEGEPMHVRGNAEEARQSEVSREVMHAQVLRGGPMHDKDKETVLGESVQGK
jgi:hypothetical protein